MTEKDIQNWFKQIAKKVGVYDIVMHPTEKAYVNDSVVLETFELWCVQNDPKYCSSEQINNFAFTILPSHDLRTLFNHSINLRIVGNTWTNVKTTIENIAKNNCYIEFPGVNEPLIKPGETFEEAAIRFELNASEKFDVSSFIRKKCLNS